jgi:hypothetical protein
MATVNNEAIVWFRVLISASHPPAPRLPSVMGFDPSPALHARLKQFVCRLACLYALFRLANDTPAGRKKLWKKALPF